jgi:molecular chaperone GrpE
MDKDNNVLQDELQENQSINSADQGRVSEQEEEIKKLRDLLIREKAENENLRKRFRKELEDAHKFAITNFAKAIIEQLEDLFRALDNVDQGSCASHKEFKTLFEGVEMSKNNMLKNFGDFDIRRINPLNEMFDHDLHQAISQVVDNSKEPGTVVNVVQAGYIIKDRLLRPAIVIVSKKEE